MQDRLLIWRFKCGSGDALRRIYEKYEDDMLTVAVSLMNDLSAAEDVVHDVFVSFAQSADKIGLAGSLRAYLATCVANLARDRIRARNRHAEGLGRTERIVKASEEPSHRIIRDEQLERLNLAMAQLPIEQREVIALHLRGGMTFRAIARAQNVSINTVQSRYRYGLEKLRSLLNGEMEK